MSDLHANRTTILDTIDELATVADELASRVKDLQEQVAGLREHARHAPAAGPAPELLKVTEATTYLGVSRSTLYQLIDQGLPTVKFGAATRLRKADLDTFIETRLVTRKEVA